MDQAGSLRRMARGINGEIKAGASYGKLRGLAVASGKGGVGKTNTVANLAYALKREGKRALVFDADMGLGNIHILLGVAPRYNLDSVLSGEKTLDEIILRGPGGIEILPASSGAREFSELTGEEKLALKTELEALEENYDFILFDIGAGISSNVMYFCSAASEIAVITTGEPTAFADAYALIKVLSRSYDTHNFQLIVNNVKTSYEGENVKSRLEKVADRFGLNVRLDFLGHIPTDDSVSRAVRSQRLFIEAYPNSKAAEAIRRIASRLIISRDPVESIGWEKALSI